MKTIAGARWSEEELRACVRGYADLWKAQQAGRSFDSGQVLKQLAAGPIAGRAEGSPRMRFGNISYVMERAGKSLLIGFKPLRNISEKERERLASMLREEGVL